MYRYTVHNLKPEGGELHPPALGYSLHSFVYAPGERILAVWIQTGELGEADWGASTWANREVNDPVVVGTA